MNIQPRAFCVCFLGILLFSLPMFAQENPATGSASHNLEKKQKAASRDANPAEEKRSNESSTNAPVTPVTGNPAATHIPQQPKYSKAIADNSFFIEEAYNQEKGVVQHIQNATWFRTPSRELGYTFTQEWPVISPKHQLSYMIPYSFPGAGSTGLGDVMINYRYQLTSEEDHGVALAPRASLILPSGSVAKGLGIGSTGVQLNLPASKRASEKLAVHGNVGVTLLPRAQWFAPNERLRHNLSMAHLGGSVIWLQRENFNLMLEYLTTFANDFDETGKTFRYQEHIVSPGLRFAINAGSLQVVPGFAVPLRFGQGERHVGLMFYLSFEHPFARTEER